MLAQLDWYLAHFGFSNLTLATAHTIAKIGGAPWFYHIENVRPEALALLMKATDEIYFDNVMSIDVEGISRLDSSMHLEVSDRRDYSYCRDGVPVYRELRGSISRFPVDVQFWRD